MEGLGNGIARARIELGLTQSELSSRADVSLATVQNIEAGRANPSVGTLSRVLSVLGLELDIGPAPVDWDMLAALGIPLGSTGGATVRPTPELLVRQLYLGLAELSRSRADILDHRKLEAMQATLYALRAHFPEFHARYFGRSLSARRLLPEKLSGRLIRLSRVAAANLAEYV